MVFQSLEWLWVLSQSLAIDLEIIFVHRHGAGVHGSRHRWSEGGSPVFELVHGVVMQVVEEPEAVVAHDIRLLRDRGWDHATAFSHERLADQGARRLGSEAHPSGLPSRSKRVS